MQKKTIAFFISASEKAHKLYQFTNFISMKMKIKTY